MPNVRADEIVAVARGLRLITRLWGRRGRSRIYLDGLPPRVSIYLDCDGPSEDITAAALRIIAPHPITREQRAALIQERAMPLLYCYVTAAYRDVPLSGEVDAGVALLLRTARDYVALHTIPEIDE
jgi:hypothetical protein